MLLTETIWHWSHVTDLRLCRYFAKGTCKLTLAGTARRCLKSTACASSSAQLQQLQRAVPFLRHPVFPRWSPAAVAPPALQSSNGSRLTACPSCRPPRTRPYACVPCKRLLRFLVCSSHAGGAPACLLRSLMSMTGAFFWGVVLNWFLCRRWVWDPCIS